MKAKLFFSVIAILVVTLFASCEPYEKPVPMTKKIDIEELATLIGAGPSEIREYVSDVQLSMDEVEYIAPIYCPEGEVCVDTTELIVFTATRPDWSQLNMSVAFRLRHDPIEMRMLCYEIFINCLGMTEETPLFVNSFWYELLRPSISPDDRVALSYYFSFINELDTGDQELEKMADGILGSDLTEADAIVDEFTQLFNQYMPHSPERTDYITQTINVESADSKYSKETTYQYNNGSGVYELSLSLHLK